ncbi:MAG: hypothetical protein IT211_12900 [Armatimonadetes bacterium]|nr:hypothetical protein [Armatimonadota bacterium]
MIQNSTKLQGAAKLFSSLLRAALLAPLVAATVFVLAWYSHNPLGGVGESLGLFGAMFLVMLAITVVLTLALLLSGEIVRRVIPSMAIHTVWRALLFGVVGGAIAGGVLALLLQWLHSGSEVFSVAMVSCIVGGIVTGLTAEAAL